MQYNKYYNAKLLLSAEYLVLNGAKALAVPLKFGQRLQVDENEQGFLSWLSIAHDGTEWFNAKYSLKDFSIIESSDPEIAKHSQRLLLAARKLNPGFCSKSMGCHLISTLNYPIQWGLGSSSTLIAAIAGWAGLDPFALHFEVSNGSGYDIACAVSQGPILYSVKKNKPGFERIAFSPAYADRIFFVYQGNKQDSAEGIQKYQNRNLQIDENLVDKASSLTERMRNAASLPDFEEVLSAHEILISNLLGVPSIRQTRFNDLPGQVKSLGAWGGDFCMLTWNEDTLLLPAYLKSKGIHTWFNFHDIVL
ncbi:MAG: GYDIA family GHMP kinase [Bacteroidota bacterium]